MTMTRTERSEGRVSAAALGRLGLQRGASGPRNLVIGATCVVLALVAMLGSLAYAANAARGALSVIGHESGPQVVATADLYFALSDVDTQVATVLLLGDTDPETVAAARDEYTALRGDIAQSLLEAHRLAGEAGTQRETIESIMTYYGQYEQYAAEALLLAEQTEYQAGEAPDPILSAYREAAELMRGWILPQAYNLTLENGTIVRRSYDEAQGRISWGLAAVALTGAAALIALAALQIHLGRAFRRVFNPSLLVATLVTGLYLGTGLAVLSAEQDALTDAKEDGFDAALSLGRAKAISNSLHADEIRYLLDPSRAAVNEQTYFDKAQQLVYVEAGNIDQYLDGLASLDHPDYFDGGDDVPGLLAGGYDGGQETHAAATSYLALIRADANMRESDAPVAARLETLQAALAEYETDLAELSEAHQDVFADAVAEGEAAIADFAFLLPATFVSLAVFTFSGIAPRLREYL